MTVSFAYSPARDSALTIDQLTELQTELLEELRRLTRDSESSAKPRDIRTQSRIKLIMEALKRLQAGVYGTCLICRSSVPYARLAVIPETKTCIRCG